MITVQKMRMTLKARETVMTTTAIQACIKRTWERQKGTREGKQAFSLFFPNWKKKFSLLEKKNKAFNEPGKK